MKDHHDRTVKKNRKREKIFERSSLFFYLPERVRLPGGSVKELPSGRKVRPIGWL